MESGPRQMYAVQTAAFDFRRSHVGIATDSTPTSPPTRKPLDLEAIAAQKRHIVNNLPTHCSHCNAEFPPQSIVELKDGSVTAYCKKKGACGKSHVLFAGIELKQPIYEQVCVFRRIEPKFETTSNLPTTEHVPVEVDMEQLLRSCHREVTLEDHDPTCASCGKRNLSHHHDVDQNGWRIARYEVIRPPRNWPVFNKQTGSWK